MSAPPAEVNRYLNECLAGIPEDISSIVIDALALLSGQKSLTEEVDKGLSFQDKVALVRHAYTALLNYLAESSLDRLNEAQRLFVDTGAIADVVVFEDSTGRRYEVELLSPPLYQQLRNETIHLDEETLPRWSRNIYRVEDQFNAIALGVLEPEGLDKKNLAKFRATRSLEHQMDVSREQTTILNNTYYALLQQSRELFEQMETLFDSYYRYVQQVPVLQDTLDRARRYNRLIAARDPLPEEREEITKVLNDPTYRRLGQDIEAYADQVIQILGQIRENSQDIDIKNQKLKEITSKLIHAGAQDVGSVRNRHDIIFDEETLRLIRSHVQALGSYAVAAAQQSPLKIPESTTRILLNAHARGQADPLKNCYCTVQNVTQSLEKIFSIHINLFERDEAYNPIVPPILIEPIRNYTEWTGERFMLGFVSGEPSRHGSRHSFSPVDMALLRLCGMYAFRDKIFDYRGNRLEGNLMADYSARLESKTAVKWIGDEKKYKLVTVMQEVDAASRSEAVEDYMEFIFHAANDFPAPLNLSKRKMAVMLRYITIQNPIRTIALLLRYVADKEPDEARKVLLQRAGHDRSRARDQLEQACARYGQNLPESASAYIKELL
ncbi:MAG: hypothetical protein CVV27_01540 [Candidatus Melainabacteria bacterium HGW-Melainabacteria-1]|nr:MAG: hypothetical protein CVV27_01540 [Candidatus Melainabacteria bacterium HGW-Melainabacteria-1]